MNHPANGADQAKHRHRDKRHSLKNRHMKKFIVLPRFQKQLIAIMADMFFLPLTFALALLLRYDTASLALFSQYLWLILAAPLAAQDLRPPAPYAYTQLDDPAQEAKALALMETLRCLKC